MQIILAISDIREKEEVEWVAGMCIYLKFHHPSLPFQTQNRQVRVPQTPENCNKWHQIFEDLVKQIVNN